ncbi:MAG: YggS family pyridoxal phosphate-dependent enzyme [Gallionella sp.]
MTTIASNLQAVNNAIVTATAAAGRGAGEVKLLAVSKTFRPDDLREAYIAGQTRFAENYLQEALEKIALLGDIPIEWHFIGPIQSNKTRPIAEKFSWVHSVDRLKVALRLSEQRPELLPPLQVCMQVNVSGESSKSGVAPDQAESLARQIASLPRLKLRGLMSVPAPTDDPALQRMPFAKLRELRDRINLRGVQLDTLSMGMSHDFAVAIAEGATIVRVGTAIFGSRNYTD